MPFFGCGTFGILRLWFRNTAAVNALKATNAPRLGGPQEGWITAYVHSAIFAAAETSRTNSRATQQVAVTHAAHAALSHVLFALQPNFIANAKAVLAEIGPTESEATLGKRLGEEAAKKVAISRAGDGIDNVVRALSNRSTCAWRLSGYAACQWTWRCASRWWIKPFAGVAAIDLWRAPPDPTKPGYDKYIKQILDKGGKTSQNRTAEESQIGQFWYDSSTQVWNRLATTIIGDRNANDIFESAKFYALYNWAMANAVATGFKTKYKSYDTWRPVTAIRYQPVYLSTGESFYDPEWLPFMDTPGHPDYLSGHSVFGGSAGSILKRYLKTSSITHLGTLPFASDEGILAGEAAAEKVWNSYVAYEKGFGNI
ncbi:phosphatidic acid phosphatase type 2/haloperoxidase [Coprinopsis sp. MPI-PUGE-AT-0042]|nr:phosphatidic acid phosphatase type 2/haloperoxidase [Coprinopsis sp. MPI-PUGE-AT-0042]